MDSAEPSLAEAPRMVGREARQSGPYPGKVKGLNKPMLPQRWILVDSVMAK